MLTKYVVMYPNHPANRPAEENLPEDEAQLIALIRSLLGGANPEHIPVVTDYNFGNQYQNLDLFVDADRDHKKLAYNEAATKHYRCESIEAAKAESARTHTKNVLDPESLPWIAGPAVLFNRKVWRQQREKVES